MKKKTNIDISGVWEEIYPKMLYTSNLINAFPDIKPALESYLWANIELNIFQTKAKDFKKVVNKCILSVLSLKDENLIPLNSDTITGLDFMYYALFRKPPNIDAIEIPPVPEEILTPDIVKNMIERYRNY